MTTKRLLVTLTLGLGLTLALLWSLNGVLPTVRAATFTVETTADSGDRSLRWALAQAGDNDTIDFDLTYPATITLSSELIVSESITIDGPGAEQLFISGNDASRVFNITGASVVLRDLTVTRGKAPKDLDGGGIYFDNVSGALLLSDVNVFDNYAYYRGGGMYVREGSVTLSGGQIISNAAEYGGGVYVSSGRATLDGGQIISNAATDDGGGVFVAWSSGAFTQTGVSTIARNAAGASGGGVYVSYGRATLNGGQVVSNSAHLGGGVSVWNSSAAFTQTGGSMIVSNTASYGGGGLYVWSGKAMLNGGQIISNSSDRGGGVYVVGEVGAFVQTGVSTIAGNTADYGGGVHASNGRATLSGGQIISNAASNAGGGVYVSAGTSVFTQTGGSTIARNTAGSSGGGVGVGSGRATLSGGQIISNSADYGGGVYVSSGSVTLSGGQITSNAAEYGGGMCVNRGRATLNGGQVAANHAPQGSALDLISSDAAVTTTAPITLSGDVYQSAGSFYGSDHDLRVDGALTVISGTFRAPPSFDLSGVFSHTGGTYYQTRSVTGSGDVGFPKAGGVLLDANGQDLGSTQVALTAGALCAGASAGDAVAHCYVITPTNATGRDARVTFYYNDAEVPSGHACSAMQAHRWDGSWDHALTRDAAYGSDGRMCGSDPQSIRVTNVMTFSPFALRGPLFNLTAQPDHLIANGADESLLTASAPPFLAGRVVTFSWNLGYAPSPVTDTINASGVASYTYVAGNSPGTDVVTAIVHDEQATRTATVTLQLDASPLLGTLSSVYWGELITYTFTITNVGTVSDTNVVLTGSIPANTELVWVDNGLLNPTGGDYGWGYVSTLTYPNVAPGETHVLAWSVRTLLLIGDIHTQAHARSDQNVLRLPLQDRVYRVLLPFAFRNAEFGR